MKKTMIITVAMLCVFGAVVMFGADRVSNDWQQPQQDDVEISTVSPIEQVENSIKKYEYDILSKDNIDETCITAYSYDIEKRIDIVSVHGGDGHYHDVEVEWDDYLPTKIIKRSSSCKV